MFAANSIEELIAHFICATPGLADFILRHPELDNFNAIIESFKKEQIENGSFNNELELMLKILLEKHSSFIENSDKGIHYLNKHIQVDDSEMLRQFIIDTKDSYLDEYDFRETERQLYKATTEKIAFQKVDFSNIIEDYTDCDHPYICSKIAIAYLNAKKYDIGLVFLQKALNHVFSSPNIYWHNPTALYGCVDALYEFQHLLGREGMSELSECIPNGISRILQCLYLYLSRAIHMCDYENAEKDNEHIPHFIIHKINYLSIRADLIYFYRQEFAYIFDIGVNPDIQFMSDKATAYSLAMNYGIAIVAQDAYQDALNMYQYGNLSPNNSGGYIDIEDATFVELIERGQKRSESLANTLLDKYKNSEFYVLRNDLADCISYLRERLISGVSLSFYEFIGKRSETYNRQQVEVHELIQKKELSKYEKLLVGFAQKKENHIQFQSYLTKNGVSYFYHFTDRRNLESILKHKGLYSWKYSLDNNIPITYPGGDDQSKILDKRHGLEDYVRLSFCDDHPMVWRLKCAGYDLVLLKIKVDVAWSKDTLFSDINAADSLHSHGGTFEDLKRVDLKATRMHYVSKSDPSFKKHQAEVMVKSFIPIEYITNLNNPITL